MLIFLLIAAIIPNLTNLDYKKFYKIYNKKDNKILSTYSYLVPEKIEIFEKDGKKRVLLNKNRDNYFIFKKEQKIIPYFNIFKKEQLYGKIGEENLNKEILKIFNNEQLLNIFIKTKYNSVNKNILEIFNERELKKELLLKRFSITKKVEIINNLKKDNVEKLKRVQKLFLPIVYSDYKEIFDTDYLESVFKKIVKIKNRNLLRAIFSIKKINKKIITLLFNENYKKEEKIFIFETLIGEEFNYKKKILDDKVRKNIILEKNSRLMKLYGYYLPKIFIINDISSIYNKLGEKEKITFLNGFILQKELKIDQNFMSHLINNYKTKEEFFNLLNYSNKLNIYYSSIEKEIIKFKNIDLVLSNSTLYINNEILDLLKKREKIFLDLINQLIYKKRRSLVVIKYLKKIAFDFDRNIYHRIIYSLYLISVGEKKEIFKFINKIHKNNNLKYKTDELYISNILPELIKNYTNRDFYFYKKLFKTENKVVVETLLSSIHITKDKRFIKVLKSLLDKKEISLKVENLIVEFNNN